MKDRSPIDPTGPKRDKLGRYVFDHAAEVPYLTGAFFWQQRINELKMLGAQASHQVVVIPTTDLTEKISNLVHPSSDKNPVAIAKFKAFPNYEDLLYMENEAIDVKHITIISSPTNYSDLFHILQVASHYKESLGTKYVTLLASTLPTTRQDKNSDTKGKYRPISVNIHSTIAALSTSVDSFMVFEPHSFAAQTSAIDLNRPFLPISPWKYLLDKVTKKGISIDNKKYAFTKENTLIVRPDQGRNIAASRIAKNCLFDHVSFDKKRVDPTKTILLPLSDKDQKRVKGKICLVYDDVLATCGTVGDIADKLNEYGTLGLVIIGVHGEFTEKWEKHISNPMIKKIYVTDSRNSIGDIQPYIDSGKIEVISIDKNISEILKADSDRVNFWINPKYKHLVLQSNGQDETG